MPASSKPRDEPPFVAGVDGCRGGWVAVKTPLDRRKPASVMVFRAFSELYDVCLASARMSFVDMPVGLADQGRRACEAMARRKLRPKRHTSVFATPARPMLECTDYAAANAWGKAQGPGRGLTKQTWFIMDKIREVDALITPALQARIAEAHPELAFWRLNGASACEHAKKYQDGRRERAAILRRAGLKNPARLVAMAKNRAAALPGTALGADDVLDACALALSARARLDGRAVRLSDDTRDTRGLVMEIWG